MCSPITGCAGCDATAPDLPCGGLGCVAVDTNDPDCSERRREECESVTGCTDAPSIGPPGDACIHGEVGQMILDGDVVRRDPYPPPYVDIWFSTYLRGQVLDNGTRIEYTLERRDRPEDPPNTRTYRRVR